MNSSHSSGYGFPSIEGGPSTVVIGQQSQQEKVNILLVDDRVDNLMALKAILSPLNENLVEATSGREALKALLEQDFAVILMDVMMPDMDGLETARLIRKRDKSRLVPIIFITANLVEEKSAFEGYEAGAVDYIIKPFPPEILRSKVLVFIDLFKKTEQVRRQAEMIRIIEQREYENRLHEAREKMEEEAKRVVFEQKITQAVIQHAPIGIVRLERDGAISDVNPTFCRLFGIDAAACHGKPVVEALPWLPTSLLGCMQEGKSCRIGDLKIAMTEGSYTQVPMKERYWDLIVWPIKDLKGEVVNTILAATDVTERVLLEEQRKDFVGTLAHDLQTPVIASDRALELLLTRLHGRLEADLEKLISMLKRNNQHLLRMIQNLLEIYHYEAGARSLSFDQVDLRSLVVTCVDDLTPLAREQGLSIKCEMEDASIKARADRTGLRRVVTNLLDNAIKFSRPGDTIIVHLQSQGNDIVLAVEDTGPGISKEDQAHLFERFWHGTGQRHASFKSSSGLGLYLCRQIIEAHGGRIECESELGKMAKFIVKLPAQPKDATKTTSATSDELTVGVV